MRAEKFVPVEGAYVTESGEMVIPYAQGAGQARARRRRATTCSTAPPSSCSNGTTRSATTDQGAPLRSGHGRPATPPARRRAGRRRAMMPASSRALVEGVEVSPDHLIGGQRVPSPDTFEDRSPLDWSWKLADIARGDATAAHGAVTAAQLAFRPWADLGPAGRAEHLHRARRPDRRPHRRHRHRRDRRHGDAARVDARPARGPRGRELPPLRRPGGGPRGAGLVVQGDPQHRACGCPPARPS